MRTVGKISSWNEERGFGFVKPINDGKEIFIHIKEFNWKPEEGQEISFVTGSDKQGRTCAQNAILYGDFLEHEKQGSVDYLAWVLFLLCVVSLVFLVFLDYLSLWVFPVYIGMGFVSFFLYWYDKDAAQREVWRVPEMTLHLSDVLCGWFGAIVAQQVFRHKTKKVSFRVGFWITVLVNICGVYWLS